MQRAAETERLSLKAGQDARMKLSGPEGLRDTAVCKAVR